MSSRITIGLAAPSLGVVAGAPRLRSIAAASNADGRIEVFGVNQLGEIFHRWQQVAADNTSWSPWAQMDGQLTSIAVARNAGGVLQVFGTNALGALMTRSQQPKDAIDAVTPAHPGPAIDNWTNWTRMGIGMTKVAAATRNAKIEIFGTNTAGTISRRSQNFADAVNPSATGAWSEWQSLGSQGVSTAVTAGMVGEAQVMTTYANTVYQLTETPDGTMSNGWVALPGRIHSDLSVAKDGGNLVLLMGVDPDGKVYLDVNNGGFVGGWLGWSALPGSTVMRSDATA